MDSALGCTPWQAPDLANGAALVPALPLDELQAAADQGVALVPGADRMVVRDGRPNLAKQNLYRAGVDAVSRDLQELDAEGAAIPPLLHYDGPAAYAARAQRLAGAATVRLPRDARRPRPRRWRSAATLRDATGRKRVLIGMTHAWCRLHILLCIVALGLLIWHISFAVLLLIGAR